ncbi:hypothetical protein ACSV5M_21605 [Cellvibrio sp. ARAG 10.3]|uniref:hypothetical protein n=1 Tax=Cellvibrio sp. ARAG 10.3 TaxID=3451358 RepID=UPI003F45087E
MIFCQCNECKKDIRVGEQMYCFTFSRENILTELSVQPLYAKSLAVFCRECSPHADDAAAVFLSLLPLWSEPLKKNTQNQESKVREGNGVEAKELVDIDVLFKTGEGSLILNDNMPDDVILKLIRRALVRSKGASFTVHQLPGWHENF